MTWNIQSESFTAAQCSYTTLKFIYNIGSKVVHLIFLSLSSFAHASCTLCLQTKIITLKHSLSSFHSFYLCTVALLIKDLCNKCEDGVVDSKVYFLLTSQSIYTELRFYSKAVTLIKQFQLKQSSAWIQVIKLWGN